MPKLSCVVPFLCFCCLTVLLQTTKHSLLFANHLLIPVCGSLLLPLGCKPNVLFVAVCKPSVAPCSPCLCLLLLSVGCKQNDCKQNNMWFLNKREESHKSWTSCHCWSFWSSLSCCWPFFTSASRAQHAFCFVFHTILQEDSIFLPCLQLLQHRLVASADTFTGTRQNEFLLPTMHLVTNNEFCPVQMDFLQNTASWCAAGASKLLLS